MGIADVFTRRSDGRSEPATPVPPPVRPSLRDQLATLARLGLEPVGATAEEIAGDREVVAWARQHPYVATMHALARGQDGELTAHPRVTTVDLEHVVGPDSYPDLVRKLAATAGTTGLLGDVSGSVDRARGRWVLRFTVGGLTREIHPLLDGTRADADVLTEIFQAVAGPDQRPASVRHGQTVTVAYVPSRHRAELQRVLDRWASLA
jgi:hypothetical protein